MKNVFGYLINQFESYNYRGYIFIVKNKKDELESICNKKLFYFLLLWLNKQEGGEKENAVCDYLLPKSEGKCQN